MWRWIKRWRDWLMNDLLPTYRIRSAPRALHHSYEKAGLVVHDQPIPWNAEAVLLEANLSLPRAAMRIPADFTLILPGHEPLRAEAIRKQESDEDHRFSVLFRLMPPGEKVTATLQWKDREIGKHELEYLSRGQFLDGLKLNLPTLIVNLGRESVACRTFVATQGKSLTASALLNSPTSLAPLADLELFVDFHNEKSGETERVTARLASSQLAGRQALLIAAPSRFPRRVGVWTAVWMLGESVLARQEVRGISVRQFYKSLRVSGTRFVCQAEDGTVRLVRSLKEEDRGGARVGPCFLVCSREAGMAGLCSLQVAATVVGAVQPPLLWDQDVVVSDGPTVVAPGTLAAAELEQVSGFELRLQGKTLSLLPLAPAPRARFNAEGGFVAPPDFTWTSVAEDELDQRLSKLLEERFRRG